MWSWNWCVWTANRDATKLALLDRLEAVQRRRPAGPLAVTFVRGTIRKVADRFDAIMASTRLNVHHVEHNYEDAVSAGSDHSYVLATLELDR